MGYVFVKLLCFKPFVFIFWTERVDSRDAPVHLFLYSGPKTGLILRLKSIAHPFFLIDARFFLSD